MSRSSDPHGPSKALTNSEDRLAKIVSSKSHQTRDLCVTSASGARITPSPPGDLCVTSASGARITPSPPEDLCVTSASGARITPSPWGEGRGEGIPAYPVLSTSKTYT